MTVKDSSSSSSRAIHETQAIMFLITSLSERIASLESKLDEFYGNGISQAKRDIEVISLSLNTMSESLKKHLDWHCEHDKKSRYLYTLVVFLIGVVAGKLGPAIESLVVRIFGLM